MHAIPTIYKSVQFRSRLEAKWAAFFDILGWRWEYEPFDLAGWIPDFMLFGKSQPLLVEVKPIIDLSDELADDVSLPLEKSELREKYEILIVGVTPLNTPESAFDDPTIGWLGEWMSRVRYPAPEFMKLWFCKAPWQNWKSGGLGFGHAYGSYYDRMTGNYDGNICGDLPLDEGFIQRSWAKAGNMTQWKAPK